MNLQTFLDLEEVKDTALARGLTWWITEKLGRSIEQVMWWNATYLRPTLSEPDAKYIELSAIFKDGSPFSEVFKAEELDRKAGYMKGTSKLIYHKMYNCATQTAYFVRNGEDVSNPVSLDEMAAEIRMVALGKDTGKIIVSFEPDAERGKAKQQDTCTSVSDLPPRKKQMLLHLMRVMDNVALGDIANAIGDEYVGEVLYEMYVIKQELEGKR